jgi:hypothetical protein
MTGQTSVHRIPDRPRPGQALTADSNAARHHGPAVDRGEQATTSPHDPRGWPALEGVAADGRDADNRHHTDCDAVCDRCVRRLPGRGPFMTGTRPS